MSSIIILGKAIIVIWPSKTVVNIETNIIFMYSDIKINANNLAAYSVLNPDTSSLSPSVKSNGVRLVSAKRQVNQIYRTMGKIKQDINIELLNSHWSLIEFIKVRMEINHSANVTSYEIVCAIPRKAPNKEYLELEDQPMPIVE